MASLRKTGNAVKRLNPVAFINTEITKLVSHPLVQASVPIGPGVSHLRGADLNDAIVLSRLRNKFVPSSEDNSKALHVEAITKMISHDMAGFKFEPTKVSGDARSVIYRARCALHDHFKGFKPSNRFRAPTGESALQNFGEVDIMYKLGDTTHWEVSPSALPHATAICYSNLWLKRLVRHNFREKEPTGKPWKLQAREWYVAGLTPYQIFGKMFASLCTLNDCVRLTSIPKNAKARRVISMVPFWNMVCQLSLMGDMRQLMYDRMGINLNTLADLHKGLISHRHYATIDLRNASNSVWHDVVEFLFPGAIKRHFNRLLNKTYEYTLSSETEYGYFNMFSPMGCGLTFDVMTLMLLYLGRQISPSASVFGDDILIHQDAAPLMTRVIESIGMEVNDEKSFIDGSFSESCGGFYNHTTQEHIVCYDFLWSDNKVEAYTVCNKLLLILEAKQCSIDILCLLRETHDRILCKLGRFSVPLSALPNDYTLTGEVLWGHEGDAKKHSSVVCLISEYYQRKMVVSNNATLKYESNPVKDHISTYACYFLRGESYAPNRAKQKLVYQLSDAFSGTPFAKVPLLSFV